MNKTNKKRKNFSINDNLIPGEITSKNSINNNNEISTEKKNSEDLTYFNNQIHLRNENNYLDSNSNYYFLNFLKNS